MHGNSLNEFIDDLYHNPEKEIAYQGKKYMIAGFINEADGAYTLTVYTMEEDCETLFSFTSIVRQECVEAFEKEKIFNGKTIYEAEKDIEVLFG